MNPEILDFHPGRIDTHVHTRHSCDSKMDPSEACHRALELGLRALIFTEHMDFDPTDEGFGFYDVRAIESSLDRCRREFPEMKIFRGVEVTYQPQYRDIIADFVRQGKFDYTIGSVHMIGCGDISRKERQEDYFGGRSESEAYGAYFQEVRLTAESGLFDALGHLDLCKKYGVLHYGPFDWKRYREPIEEILGLVASRGMVLELNTSGLRQNPQDTYPNLEVIKRFQDLGGRYVFLASDAHESSHLAFGFKDLLGLYSE